jgi:hypothetical protein
VVRVGEDPEERLPEGGEVLESGRDSLDAICKDFKDSKNRACFVLAVLAVPWVPLSFSYGSGFTTAPRPVPRGSEAASMRPSARRRTAWIFAVTSLT